MMLFGTIDALLIGTRYLSWGISLLGMVGALLLLFINMPLGIASVLVFSAAFLMFMGVTLLLLPKMLAKGVLSDRKKRNVTGAAALVLALIIMGITYLAVGGFPELNLLFI